MIDNPDVAVVGAGIAGLHCAGLLSAAGLRVQIFEAADRVGGRMTSDVVDGFTLDRGFQVLLPGYPTAGPLFSLGQLAARPLTSGILLRSKGRFHRLLDPTRRPAALLDALRAPLGSVRDRMMLGLLGFRGRYAHLAASLPAETTGDYLLRLGFSRAGVAATLRPFLAGAFLEPALETPASVFQLVFPAFSGKGAWLPAQGMRAAATALEARLPGDSLRLETAVAKVEEGAVTLANGERVGARAIVLAVEPWALASLVNQPDLLRPGRGTRCLYFATDRAPIEEPVLAVDAEQSGPINHWCVVSQVCPSYAPSGAVLISASTVGVPADHPDTLIRATLDQFRRWFGASVDRWHHLKTIVLPNALPSQQTVATVANVVPSGVYLCGDHMHSPTQEGAALTAAAVAAAVLATRSRWN